MLVLALFACAHPVDDSAVGEPIDLRVDEDPAADVNLRMGEAVVPPYAEAQFCTFGTWTGEDLAIHRSVSRQDPTYGHHAVLFVTSASTDDYPDGAVLDCGAKDATLMMKMLPLAMPTEPADENGDSAMDLPEGMAVKLTSGTRYVIQSHYVNTGADPLLIADAVALYTIDEVQTWAATFAQTSLSMQLPAGQITTVDAGCTFGQDANVLTMSGHMHEHGMSFFNDHVSVELQRQRVYEIPDWDPSMRDAPPVLHPEPGELVVRPGDRFEFQCTFDNDEDHDLGFPEEMCALFGIMYPAEEPVICLD